jgi:hypothetical protein
MNNIASDLWSLDALRVHIKTLDESKHALLVVVDSLGRYIRILRYHLESVQSSMQGFVDEDEPDSDELVKLGLGISDRQNDFRRAEIESEANVLGCAHVSRAIFDLFAQLVNNLILQSPVSDRACSIHKMAEKTPDSPLKKQLQELIESSWFIYLSDFVNTAKHRRLVRQSPVISLEHKKIEIHIDSFEYDGRAHPRYSRKELLIGTLEVKNRVIKCGNALNAQLTVADDTG